MAKEDGALKAHVLVLPSPAQGHINALLQFSKRLVFKGLKTTLAIPISMIKSMLADPHSTIEIHSSLDGFDNGGYGTVGSPEAYDARLQDVGSRTLASLVTKFEELGCPIKVIIYDAFCPWALDVAK